MQDFHCHSFQQIKLKKRKKQKLENIRANLSYNFCLPTVHLFIPLLIEQNSRKMFNFVLKFVVSISDGALVKQTVLKP